MRDLDDLDPEEKRAGARDVTDFVVDDDIADPNMYAATVLKELVPAVESYYRRNNIVPSDLE